MNVVVTRVSALICAHGLPRTTPAKPIVITLRARAREIQTELDNRGLTPAQVMAADAERRGPILNGGTARIRAQAYAAQIDAALEAARELLCP